MTTMGVQPPSGPDTPGRDTLAPDSLGVAAAAAARAADLSGVRIRLLGTVEELQDVEVLVNQTWRAEVSISMLRALRKAGNFVSGAYRDEVLVGACIGFFGIAGRTEMHSHLAVIDPRHRTAGIGAALKLHQRAWAMAQGVTQICWTYDPLERRNAYVNLTKLAARPVEYLVNFYGDHGDGDGAPFPTDRLMLTWDLTAAAVTAAAGRRATPPDLALLRAGDSTLLLAMDARGAPQDVPDTGASVLLIGTPQEVALLRTHDAGLALEWRLRLRHHLGGALTAGARVTGFVREGFYVLKRV
ncbi:MAG: GNAT family N-acetyltransferase [Nocardioides sp.]